MAVAAGAGDGGWADGLKLLETLRNKVPVGGQRRRGISCGSMGFNGQLAGDHAEN